MLVLRRLAALAVAMVAGFAIGDVAGELLSKVEATELSEEEGDQPAPLLAHRRRDHVVGAHADS